jgi:hypothetical protein
MCHVCDRAKLLKRADAILADVEGGYELKRPHLAKLIRELSRDVRDLNNVTTLVQMTLAQDTASAVQGLAKACGIEADERS